MTKQQKTYMLLFAALVVWGLIGFKIYKGLYGDDNQVTKVTSTNNKYTPKPISESKTYNLKADYRDPFLGKPPTQKKKTKIVKRVAQNDDIPFPNIIYNGIVEAGNSKSYTVTINGKQELIKVGEELHNVKLVRATSNKIVVRFQGKTKTIQLQ